MECGVLAGAGYWELGPGKKGIRKQKIGKRSEIGSRRSVPVGEAGWPPGILEPGYADFNDAMLKNGFSLHGNDESDRL